MRRGHGRPTQTIQELLKVDMDGILLVEHLLKQIRERRDRISEMMVSGNVKSLEEYKQLVGNVESLDYIGQELRQILDEAS